MAFRGIDIRQSGDKIVFRASLKDSSGAKVTTGTTSLYIFELQFDGSLKSYDFNSNTFTAGGLTTASVGMTHRTGNNGTYNTGVWTYALTTITGFTRGNIYISQVNNSAAYPVDQERQWQYGDGEGDFTVTSAGKVTADVDTIKTQTISCSAAVTIAPYVGNSTAALSVDASGRVDLGKVLGTNSAGAAGYVGVDWGNITNQTSTVAFTGSTMGLYLSQAIPTSNTAQTVGDALNAARTQAFGPWTLDDTAKTLTLFANDGTTVVKVFTLDSATAPKVRT